MFAPVPRDSTTTIDSVMKKMDELDESHAQQQKSSSH
jgi:hypothetical protein